ncbi:hypothetical protein HKX42_03835 [Salinisphaera sp. USBA-960]|nr:hypothetical protein [Salifodinibacter halophilus]
MDDQGATEYIAMADPALSPTRAQACSCRAGYRLVPLRSRQRPGAGKFNVDRLLLDSMPVGSYCNTASVAWARCAVFPAAVIQQSEDTP